MCRRVPEDEISLTVHLEDLDELHASFAAPRRATFCRLDELGLHAVGQGIFTDCAVIECRVVESDRSCRKCGCQGRARGHRGSSARPRTLRPLAHDIAEPNIQMGVLSDPLYSTGFALAA